MPPPPNMEIHFNLLCITSYKDDISKQTLAMAVLSQCLGKGSQSLCFIFEEFSVSIHLRLIGIQCTCIVYMCSQWKVLQQYAVRHQKEHSLMLLLSLEMKVFST